MYIKRHLEYVLEDPAFLRGAMAGAFFETFAVCEILKSFHNSGLDPRNYLYFYRDIDGHEIDVVICADGRLHPSEWPVRRPPPPMGHFHSRRFGTLSFSVRRKRTYV